MKLPAVVHTTFALVAAAGWIAVLVTEVVLNRRAGALIWIATAVATGAGLIPFNEGRKGDRETPSR